MSYIMSPWLRMLVRKFPGIRKTIASFNAVQTADACTLEGIDFHFDENFMDRKRLVAIAAGAIENEEVLVANATLNTDDVVIEFGCGLGIAAARVHKAITPKKHICFEANPLLATYAEKLFAQNNLNIELIMSALGNGDTLPFFAMDDYILSSFQKPKDRDDYRQIDVPTISCEAVINQHNPTAIFCDVEGAELAYLDASDFGDVRTIVVELHPKIYGNEGVAAFHKRMADHGFQQKLMMSDTYCYIR